MALGSYPEVSLAQARKKTIEARELLAQGIVPKAQRNELLETKRAETEHTFENVATAWFELKKDSVTPAYAEDIWRSLTLHVFPEMRTTPLSEVTAPMVIKLLSNRSKRQSGDCETVEPTVDVPLLRGMCTFEHGAQEQRYVELGRHRRPPM